VTNPTFPRLLEIAFGQAGRRICAEQHSAHRLVAAFLTGIKGVNQPANVVPSRCCG